MTVGTCHSPSHALTSHTPDTRTRSHSVPDETTTGRASLPHGQHTTCKRRLSRWCRTSAPRGRAAAALRWHPRAGRRVGGRRASLNPSPLCVYWGSWVRRSSSAEAEGCAGGDTRARAHERAVAYVVPVCGVTGREGTGSVMRVRATWRDGRCDTASLANARVHHQTPSRPAAHDAYARGCRLAVSLAARRSPHAARSPSRTPTPTPTPQLTWRQRPPPPC